MSFAELEKVLESMDDVKYCKICHTPFKPKRKTQILCGNPDCKQAQKRIYEAEYKERRGELYRAKHKASNLAWREKDRKKREKLKHYDEELARLERMIHFDKVVAEHGLHYGEYQAQKTLAMVEPIKLTLGDDKNAESNSDNQ